MHISHQWLCELVPGLNNIPARELADKLTMAGLEVESFADQAAAWPGIVVAEVVAKDKHPNADKLSVCRVNAGVGEVPVVCGAPNVTAGRKYPFATLGTVMPGGLEIKPVKLRGVDSCGMLCSARELGLSEEHAGLFELPADAKVGDALASALKRDDVIFGINVTPNRGDALSAWGIAREAAVLTGLKFDPTPVVPPACGSLYAMLRQNPDLKPPDVMLEDTTGCPRYSASLVTGVKIAPSPDWLQRRMEASGMRSINNIVDATNYVMLLTGHPVHAFDGHRLRGGGIGIRSLHTACAFKTLDGLNRRLEKGDLVIADGGAPVALAGIMGGENSGIAPTTTDLILEVAYFHPDVIRRTSRRLGLASESSYRFSRHVNPDSLIKAHRILQNLIVALAGGQAGEIRDVYPHPLKARTIVFPRGEILRLLGIEVPSAVVARILLGLGCAVEEEADSWLVKAPSFRADLERPADLVEEVARVYGMDKIPISLPRLVLRSSREAPASRLERECKDFFVARGFTETVHYSFGDAGEFVAILARPLTDAVTLTNPIATDMAVLRPSLLPHLLGCYRKNRLNTDKGLRLFELRKVYAQSGERSMLAFLYGGNPHGRNPHGLNRVSDFYDGNGLARGLLGRYGIVVTGEVWRDWPFHPGQAVVFKDGKGYAIARVGALHPALVQEAKIREHLYYGEIEYSAVAEHGADQVPRYHEIGLLPPVYRDMALLAPRDITHARIVSAIERFKPDELHHVELFDVFEGDKLPAGKRSLAYALLYQPRDESLTDAAVNQLHFTLVEKLKGALGVELR